MLDKINGVLMNAVQKLYCETMEASFARSDHCDFASNIAMQLSGKLGKNPIDIAEQLRAEISENSFFSRIEVAGPGFLNVWLSDEVLIQALDSDGMTVFDINDGNGGAVLLEYSCPNAFKELHTGHLYQTLIGDSMGRIYEFLGVKVYRTSFGGDVGLHAAKCMWGILQALGGENLTKLTEVEDHAAWISAAYVVGSKAYEEDEFVKAEIDNLNKKIYGLHESGDIVSDFAQIYFTTRQWSYDYFDKFYADIDVVAFDKYYPESVTSGPGLEVVSQNLVDVFSESEGAVVLDEAKSGLHTRVFVTSAGLPTYETKDLGVVRLENQDFNYEKRIIMTGNDQSEYMKVVFKALELIDPVLAAKQRHIANGTVKFANGQKMSSRLGNVTKATDVIEAVSLAMSAGDQAVKKDMVLGAIKYSLLKSKVGGDIAFDIEKSISVEGNSGPYMQYALARANSVLAKAKKRGSIPKELTDGERNFALKLTDFGQAIEVAIKDFSPHHVASFLYDLAQEFNRFYEKNRIIDDQREVERLFLVNKYQKILKQGLELLGVPTPEKI